MPTLNGEGAVEERLDEVINAYLEEEEAGLSPDCNAILEAHPDLAGGLKRFFAAHAAMERLSRPLRDFALAAQTTSGPVAGVGSERADDPPREFGDYVLLQVIGVGGMGIVYRALHRALKREVALKQIIAGPLASEADVERFRNEAEAAASLHHPNIVPIHEVGEYQGQRYLTMPLFEGGSLSACRYRFGDDPRSAARLMAVVAGAVHHAHQRGVLHRDLKPSNILLDADGQPHVADFGLARRIGVESTLTGTGAILGSPPYMAPEQAQGRVNEITAAVA